MDVLVRVLFISRKQVVAVGKSKVTTTKKTKNTSRVHNDQHEEACTLHSTLYSCQETHSLHMFQRLPSDAAYSQRCG